MNEEKISYKRGFTLKSFLFILYSSIVLMPAVIFTLLTSGVGIGGNVGFIVVLLSIELVTLLGSSLSKQEIFIIWSCSGIAASDIIFLSLLQNLYFRSISPITWQFLSPSTKLPLPLEIPNWFAPPPNSPVLLLRTFLYPDWLLPIAVTLAGWILSGKVIDLALGFLFFKLYSEEERLPFPMQEVTAQMLLTLPEKESNKKMLLTVSALIAFVYNLILYTVPFATLFQFVPIPIPWIDLTKAVEPILPGASFGISTDLLVFTSGFITPLNVVVSMFLGSFAFYFLGNYIVTKEGFFAWTPGMDAATLFQRSMISIWAYPNIGLAIAGALIPIITHPNYLLSAFKSLKTSRSKERGELSLWLILLLYLGASSIIVFMIAMLTNFPIWIAIIFVFGWSFLSSMIASRSVAISGFQVTIPYVQQATILASGYKGVDIWFAPMGSSGGAAWWCGWFKLSELMDTKYTDFIKGSLTASFLAIIFSFIYVSLFWSISPIPSPLYPAVSIYWPVNVIMSGLWITGSVATKNALQFVAGSAIVGAIVSLGLDFLKVPFSLIGFVIGTSTPFPTIVTSLIGAIFGIALQKLYGKTWYNENKSTIAAGLVLGSSLAMVIGVAIAMVVKGGWILPY
ncbi:MAG: OPT/YSL family transporter [Thermoproteota archaeon]|nr:OPT/YSL family transporter [Candidatus Brockarchaeota archaeon]